MAEYKQDLYFINIPIPKRKKLVSNLGFLRTIKDSGRFLSEKTNPAFVWTGTGRIKKLEREYHEKVRNKLKNKEIEIYLYEPICLKINNTYNCSFYSEFKYGVDYENVISEELESIRIFKKYNNLENIKIYTCDYNLGYLKKLYPDLNLYCLDLFVRHSTVYKKASALPNKIVKKFWCGNWRYTVHRHLIMSYLVHLDGTYSWNLDCDFSTLKTNEWFNLDNLEMHDRDKFIKIRDGVNLLKLKTLKIDSKVNIVKVNVLDNVYIPGDSAPGYSESKYFFDSYKECFCAVVTETRFAQHSSNISEKTFAAIESRIPMIVVAPPRTLEYLKKLGFKTFSKWWDESYDLEEDHEKRLLKIFDLIDFINKKSISDLKTIYEDMTEVLEHNLTVMKTVSHNTDVL